jgi:WD40 repeat protein
VTAHAFSPDGHFLVAGSASNGLVRTWSVDPTTGKLSLIDTEVAPASISMNGMVILTR